MNYAEVKRRLLINPEVQEAYDNPPLSIVLAKAVIEWRRDHGMSQKELASHLSTSQNQVWRIENGDANVTLNTLQKLANCCGFRISVEPSQSQPAHRLNPGGGVYSAAEEAMTRQTSEAITQGTVEECKHGADDTGGAKEQPLARQVAEV